MKREFIYHITKEKKRKISDFLKDQGYTKKVLTYLKEEPSQILKNGQPAYVNEYLSQGDILKIQLVESVSSEHILPEDGELTILYEDKDILLVNKPAGMPVHPSINHHTGTLANLVVGYYAKQGIPYVFRCLNRLDRDTSGLVLLAKHMLSGAILAKRVKEREFHREYRAIVSGNLSGEGRINAPIGRKEGSIIERKVDLEHGKEAVTNYFCLGSANGNTYVSLWLETGRTHQIRVHMKHIGYPLPGDFLYHPDMSQIPRQALHSYQLSFRHPITDEFMVFSQDIPEDMRQLIGDCREELCQMC